MLLATRAGAQNTQTMDDVTPTATRPLSTFIARRLLVLPTQYLKSSDEGLGWLSQIKDPRTFLGDVDHEIEFALSERGVKDQWAFPEAIARTVKRNPGYGADPYSLAAQWLRTAPRRKKIDQLTEPLGSQLRSLVAMQEGGRYLLMPVEVRFVKVPPAKGADTVAGPPGGVLAVHLVLLDARYSRVIAMVDVASDPAVAFSPALAASLGSHVADLVADPNP